MRSSVLVITGEPILESNEAVKAASSASVPEPEVSEEPEESLEVPLELPSIDIPPNMELPDPMGSMGLDPLPLPGMSGFVLPPGIIGFIEPAEIYSRLVT